MKLDNYECEGQMSIFDLDSWCGRTCTEPSAQITERTSGLFWKRPLKSKIKMPQFLDLRTENGSRAELSWEMGIPSLGEDMMLNFGEFLREEKGFVYWLTLRGGAAPRLLFESELWRMSDKGEPYEAITDFGTESGCEIQSVSESLSRDIEQSREARQDITTDSKGSLGTAISFQERAGKPGGGKGILIQNEHTGALSTLNNQSVVCIEGNGTRESHKGDGYKEPETMYTLNTIEQHAICIESHPKDSRYNLNSPDINQTIPSVMCHDPSHGDLVLNSTERMEKDTLTMVLENHPNDSRVKISSDGMVQTLSSRMGTGGGNVPMVMEKMETYQEVTGTLDCGISKGTGNQLANQDMFIANMSVVRRLTPKECLRLQGYPDGWYDIGEWTDSKGKKHREADAPKYKAAGNSIALPFWKWLAKRICAEYDRPVRMASLFDGIGGFPLSFSEAGAIPIWASEIEEFPIAVTKKRFGG